MMFEAKDARQFWSRVVRGHDDHCWEWTGSLLASGYGRLRVAARTVRAHRFAYELAFGPPPAGLFVCHRCDNRRCVNPGHLFLGTHDEKHGRHVREGSAGARRALRHPSLPGATRPRRPQRITNVPRTSTTRRAQLDTPAPRARSERRASPIGETTSDGRSRYPIGTRPQRATDLNCTALRSDLAARKGDRTPSRLEVSPRRGTSMMFEAKDPAFEQRFQERYDAAKVLSATLAGPSIAERLAALPAATRTRILSSLSLEERSRLLHAWPFWSRRKQQVPDVPHRTVLWLGGRGMGKNKTAAERVREKLYAGVRSAALIGPTWREVLRHMVGGKLGAAGNGSGLLDVFPAEEREQIEVKEQRGEIVFPWLGATVYLVSDETPELRGGGYGLAWCDEVCKWRHLQRLWDNLEFTMRVRSEIPPEIIVTTTPRPMRWLKELIADPDTITILGTTDENASNLDRGYIARLDRKYGGSRIARQERGGEILTENEGALFHQDIIDATRVERAPALGRVVVAIDPAVSTTQRNDPTGIIAIGIGHDGHLYVLGDASGRLTPEAWGSAALKLYDQHGADAFVGERNKGGDLVAANMRATVREKRGPAAVAKIIEVHATRHKAIRAEPVATMHEQGRLHFVGVHPEIEQEITEWDPSLGGVSPNRLDALVWGAFELAKLGVEEEHRPRSARAVQAHRRAQQGSRRYDPRHPHRARPAAAEHHANHRSLEQRRPDLRRTRHHDHEDEEEHRHDECMLEGGDVALSRCDSEGSAAGRERDWRESEQGTRRQPDAARHRDHVGRGRTGGAHRRERSGRRVRGSHRRAGSRRSRERRPGCVGLRPHNASRRHRRRPRRGSASRSSTPGGPAAKGEPTRVRINGIPALGQAPRRRGAADAASDSTSAVVVRRGPSEGATSRPSPPPSNAGRRHG